MCNKTNGMRFDLEQLLGANEARPLLFSKWATRGSSVAYPEAKGPLLQEVFNLDEGPVTLSFPAKMSVASYEDLEAHLQIFLRKAKRRADSLRNEAAEMKDPDFTVCG